jgi:MFS family permease
MESTLANFFNPARAALMPNLVSKEDLRAANSLMEVSRHIGFLAAPPAGGVLVALLGPAAIMLVDGVTFLISGITVFLIRHRQPLREAVPSEGLVHSSQMVIRLTIEGLRAIMQRRLLQVAVLLGLALNLIVSPIQVLLPLFVRDVKQADADYFGILVAGLLAGLISGSLTAPATARRMGLGKMAIAAVALLGVVITIASWPPTIWPPLIAMTVAGFAIGSLNVAQTTLLQSATSDEERGRVSATYFTFTLGVRPFGYLLMGLMASAVDVRFLFVALGALALIVAGALARMPEVRAAR